MTFKITEQGPDKDYEAYPLVLIVEDETEGAQRGFGMGWRFMYYLKTEERGDTIKIDGIVEHAGGFSANVLDDADADDYQMESERKSIGPVKEYLREKFSRKNLTGIIRGKTCTTYYREREYKI